MGFPYFILKVPRSLKPLVIEHFAAPPNIFADQVLKGALNDNTLIDKENFVIDNQDEWNSLLEKMSDNSSINFLEFSSSVDFDNYLALASFDKFDCSYVSNNQDWTLLLNQMNSFYQNPNFPNNYPNANINFDQNLVIAAFDKINGYCCGTIDITDIFEEETAIRISVLYLLNGALAKVAQPIHVCKNSAYN